MDKKTIKAILDIIKDVKDRKGLYGCQITNKYVIFTDGYVAVRLTMGEYDGLRELKPMWVGGEQLSTDYKRLGARDVQLAFNDDGGEHPNWKECWAEWFSGKPCDNQVSIRPEVFKKLTPFGDMIMTITDKRYITFTGKGVNAVACPLIK